MGWLLLIGLAIATCGILLAHRWLFLVVWLLVVYICVSGFLAQQPLTTGGLGRWLLPLAEAVSGAVVVGILLLTGVAFGRDDPGAQVDEFGLMELRRVARRALRRVEPVAWSDYLLSGAGCIVALAATVLLPRLYPLPPGSGPQVEEYGWTLLVLAGLIQLLTSQNMLKLGCGLLLIGLGLQLLYIDWTSSIAPLLLALLHVAMIVLALVVAYLSSLLYGRLETLDLGELYDGESS